ncbi:hypothetical protein CVT24_000038 [Panaeolus cyanescens]|uniref:Uncharacterized protein n=1 Tax=Panaeolus cyanescens TaxID=181874 RepID=A0A409W7D8_9AGAR|nr:hypothetical protein CVT24_000038 [Panaeolus cyanescens]
MSATRSMQPIQDVLRTSLEQMDAADELHNIHSLIGRPSPNTTFVNPVGFAPQDSTLSYAEYLLTLLRPDTKAHPEHSAYALEFDRQIEVIRNIQASMARGDDAGFLLVDDDGEPGVRFRRMVFDKRPQNMSERDAIRLLRNWTVPNRFLEQQRSMEGIFIPRSLVVFDTDGVQLEPDKIESAMAGKLVRVHFSLRCLYLARDHANGVDLFLALIKKIQILP